MLRDVDKISATDEFINININKNVERISAKDEFININISFRIM